jgi:hypothetical protein
MCSLQQASLKGANIRVAGSGGVSVVLVDESAEAVTATDFAGSRCRRWLRALRRLEFERAMRPLRVVVIDEDTQDALQVAAVEDQQPTCCSACPVPAR